MLIRLFSGAILLLGATAAGAVSVTVSGDGATVSLRGAVSWTPASADSNASGDTDYAIELAVAGTPFDAAFTAPTVGTPRELTGFGGVSVGSPAPALTRLSAGGLRLGLAATGEAIPPAAPEGVTSQVLAVQRAINRFANGALDGTAFVDTAIFFNDDFSMISGVLFDFGTEAPLIGTDFFSETRHIGFDGAAAAVIRGGAPSGPAPSPIPLPPAAALLVAGLAALWRVKRHPAV